MTTRDDAAAADAVGGAPHRRGSERSASPDLLAETFVELAGLLVTDFDLVDLFSLVVERCAALLDVAEAGLLLSDRHHRLRAMASSSERMHVIELFEIQNEEGPCLDVFRSRLPVVNASVDGDDRWPSFAPQARAAGFATVHAFPMRHVDRVIGVVNLFDDRRSTLTSREAEVAQALADIATFVILQSRAVRDATELADQLQSALWSRVVVEQAKGVLSERLGVNVAGAFAVLRDYARKHNERIADVAGRVVDHTLGAHEVAAGAHAGPSRPARVSGSHRRPVRPSPEA